jgi:hypothetical protein
VLSVPIKDIRFGTRQRSSPEAWDIHLLRGHSTLALRDRLQVLDKDDNKWKPLGNYLVANDDIEIEFRLVFDVEDHANEFSGFGVTITKATGEITTLAGVVAHRPHNFIVEAVVLNEDGDEIDKTVIRLHLHQSVEKIWLTPKTLTIRRPAPPAAAAAYDPNTRFSFTVRARFDDGTSGDVTFAPELDLWGPDENLFWLDAESGIQRIAIPQNSPIGTPIEVKIKTTSAWGDLEATGHLIVLEPWETETVLPVCEWVDGPHGTLDGSLKPEQVPNILFMGCGFPTSGFFQQHTNLLVRNLKTDRLLQPYGYLSGSMNFWRLNFPGQTAGVSVRSEVYVLSDENGQLIAKPVPPPAPPPTHGEWSLAHLIYMAGLPIPDDLALAKNQATQLPVASVEELRNLDLEQLDFTNLVDHWQTMMRREPVRNVPKKVVRRWLALANRTFIDEIDTFPSISIGAPPAAELSDATDLAFHDLRGGMRECRRVFPRITPRLQPSQLPITLGQDVVDIDDALTTALGNLWALSLADTAKFDNRAFVTPVCNVAFGREAWSSRSGLRLRLYLEAADLHRFEDAAVKVPGLPVQQAANADGLALLQPPANARPTAENWVTLAHELSHAFGLGDEYVDFAEDYLGVEADLNEYANLMTTDAIVMTNGNPSPSSIKWNWHRIQKACVITQDVEDMFDGKFRVFVAKGDGNQFKIGEGVRLRRRHFRRVIRANPRISIVEFQVDSIHPTNLSDLHDTDNMTIVLKNVAIGIDVAPFVPGSLIYVPVRDPTFPLPFPYYNLVSPAAERIIITTHGAMTGDVCDLVDEAADSGTFVQVPKADPQGKVQPQNRSRLVGIYFGGDRYACGILHPAGQCIMRDASEAASRFCPVCQYVLIDQIDPRQHGRFESEYAKEFPI